MSVIGEYTAPRFERGDPVVVIWERPSGEMERMDATFVAYPSGPGDTFRLYTDNGPIAVNGNGPTFDGIYPREERG